jgi:muramoyltetrapeptide carboxypeptidase LdcA involved in peptidoglycan recycling
MLAPRLKRGDCIRVISPARSLSMISESSRQLANRRFKDIGLEVSFSKNSEETDVFMSSSIQSRLDDIHEAFRDPSIKLVITTIGGFNSNQLLPYLDYELIKSNPKILCGYSDITALLNAIYVKTGLVTYYGPHYSNFGEKLGFEYTLEYFKKCLFYEEPLKIKASEKWSNDEWWINQEKRNFMKNEGMYVINEGEDEGVIVGGNLVTFQHLAGTDFMPSLDNAILFIEDDKEEKIQNFDSTLTALSLIPEFSKVKAVVIGRFEKQSEVTREILTKVINNNKRLNGIPIIANADFGHTDPKITFPIGGTCKIKAEKDNIEITIIEH